MGAPAAPAGDCPCGRTAARGRRLAYAACCGRFIDDFEGSPAPDAESLMRSRYTAFALRRADYLLATWHPTTRPDALDFEAGLTWLGLQVKAHLPLDATHAQVEFVARARQASGRASRLAERSRFVREGGRWYYVDGRLE